MLIRFLFQVSETQIGPERVLLPQENFDSTQVLSSFRKSVSVPSSLQLGRAKLIPSVAIYKVSSSILPVATSAVTWFLRGSTDLRRAALAFSIRWEWCGKGGCAQARVHGFVASEGGMGNSVQYSSMQMVRAPAACQRGG